MCFGMRGLMFWGLGGILVSVDVVVALVVVVVVVVVVVTDCWCC